MKYILTFLLSIFVAFGLLLIVYGIEGYWNFVEKEKVEATLTDIQLSVTPREKRDSMYQLTIEYQYNWDSKEYTYQHIEKTHKENSKRHQLERVLSNLKNAKRIIVWVNPKKPSESRLFPIHKKSISHFLKSIHFGFVFLVIPAGLLIMLWGIKDLETGMVEKIKMLN